MMALLTYGRYFLRRQVSLLSLRGLIQGRFQAPFLAKSESILNG
jgi:hypothetical protein